MERFRRSFSCAIQGIVYSITSGRNMKIHLLAAIIAISIAFVLGVNRIEWTLLMLAIFMVLSAETINTAIERTVDLITEENHPLAKLAKDLAAGGVLLTAINAVVIAVLVFGPYLIKLI
ncbi:MAG: diacylglycerol kinase [Firmicutes bacterium HGW-Firmicutes-15]|nr:MAG: diacylglycerol kinase [Firmicutes bacterium HGW-Firmicutes-15]